jgi:protein-S-isoprenylcysteine O-methyltransferase Ste14
MILIGEKMSIKGEKMNNLVIKSIVKVFFAVAVFAAVLFVCAGRLNWAAGWIYVGMISVSTIIASLLMDRDLIVERSGIRGNYKKWDIVLSTLMARILPLGTLIVCGLDARFGWSRVSHVFQMAAFILIVVGLILSDWAMIENRFFSPVVRIQRERGHTVVTTGPYQYLRHPGYAGGMLVNLLTPLMLGSWWGIIPAISTVVITVIRTVLEDKTLHEELEGYKEYAQKVRWRLLPKIW